MTNFFKHKMRRKSLGEIVGWIILGVIAVAGFAILFGFIIMWLWNALMPGIFGLTALTYWQAVGLFILLKILFGGFGGGGGGKRRHSSRHSRSFCENRSKGDFSRWKNYAKFWEEEGSQAYEKYQARLNKETNEVGPEA